MYATSSNIVLYLSIRLFGGGLLVEFASRSLNFPQLGQLPGQALRLKGVIRAHRQPVVQHLKIAHFYVEVVGFARDSD